MKIKVRPWTWRDDRGRTQGVLIATHFSKTDRKIAFVPTSELFAVADKLVDIAEEQEKKS